MIRLKKSISMKKVCNPSNSIDQITNNINLDHKYLVLLWQKFEVCTISRKWKYSEGGGHTYYQPRKPAMVPLNETILVDLLSSWMVFVLEIYVIYTFIIYLTGIGMKRECSSRRRRKKKMIRQMVHHLSLG